MQPEVLRTDNSSQDTITTIAQHFLRDYLQHFFHDNVYFNPEDSIAAVQKLLTSAHISPSKKTITMSFPEDIRDRFLFEESYTIELNYIGVLFFYRKELYAARKRRVIPFA